MARKKFKTKGIGSPLFPDMRYIDDRKGRKHNVRDKLIVAGEKNDNKPPLSTSTVATPQETPDKTLRNKVLLFFVGLLIVSVAFLPVL